MQFEIKCCGLKKIGGTSERGTSKKWTASLRLSILTTALKYNATLFVIINQKKIKINE